MRFFIRRLEAFNSDALPDWRRSPGAWRRLLILPRLAEYILFYALALVALAVVVLLMIAAWLVGVDRRKKAGRSDPALSLR
jgi:hypothetical protein